MIYFANPTTERVREAMRTGKILGAITTPDQRNAIPDGVPWIADNGLGPGRGGGAGKGARTDPEWFAWLQARPWDPALCRFAVAPDVVGNAAATLARSAPWLPKIRELGLPAALVAQNGLEDLIVPWDTFDVLFIGGTTEWKVGLAAAQLAGEARARGKGVHVGRVNSLKRLRHAIRIAGEDVTVDGTFIAFAPSTNLDRMAVWFQAIHEDGRREPDIPLPV